MQTASSAGQMMGNGGDDDRNWNQHAYSSPRTLERSRGAESGSEGTFDTLQTGSMR